MTKQMFNGVLAQVGIFPIKDSIKNMTVKKPGPEFGKQYHLEKTHTIAVKVVGLEANGAPYDRWITLGHKKFQEGRELIYQVKQDDQWIDVFEGSTVFFFYEVKGEYVNIDIKTFRVMEQAPRPERVYTFGDAAPSGGSGSNSGGGGGGFKKGGDYLKGVKVGHAVNCATDHFKANSWRFDPEGMFDVGCFCNELTTEVEKITGDGAAAGCAVPVPANAIPVADPGESGQEFRCGRDPGRPAVVVLPV